MIFNEIYTLNNGVKTPKLGYGTWMIDDSVVSEKVQEAIKVGYRHIDTAQAYGNERGVGEGIKASGISRDEIFITTKLAAEIKNYDEAVSAIEESINKLGVEYIDLMIIHSPQPWDQWREGHFFEGNLEAWKALEEAYKVGKLRAIGVSNFEEVDLNNLLEKAEIKPMVNQVLTHIGNTPFALIDFCQKHDILVQAYSPIAHGEMMKNQKITEMANMYGVSIAQLAIRYCLELGTLPLPKTEDSKHMADNTKVDFLISKKDMETLINLDKINDYGEYSYFPVYSGK